jgi:hypothetical protein
MMRKSTVGWLVGLGAVAVVGAGLVESVEAEGAVVRKEQGRPGIYHRRPPLASALSAASVPAPVRSFL